MQEPIELNAAERHLLQALTNGASNKDIALEVAKSEFTIRNQLSRLFKKLDVGNRNQAAFWYREHVAQLARQWHAGVADRRNGNSLDRRNGVRLGVSARAQVAEHA